MFKYLLTVESKSPWSNVNLHYFLRKVPIKMHKKAVPYIMKRYLFLHFSNTNI